MPKVVERRTPTRLEAINLRMWMNEIAQRHEQGDGSLDAKSAWYELIGFLFGCSAQELGDGLEFVQRIEISTGESLTPERAAELISAIRSSVVTAS